jgi:iron complex outermembrane receptor protein
MSSSKTLHNGKAIFPSKPTALSRDIRALFVLALSGSTLLGGSYAFGQQVAPHDENTLQALTVTAQKREENVQDVPSAITVLGGDSLLDSGIGRSASEVLNYVPNASAGTQQHGRPRWWIRGVGAGQQQIDLPNPVGFYLDDVYISNASATGFPLFDVDRVEVLRGPQGTLWGKNTTGGAINAISNKPTFDNAGYVKVDYSSHATTLLEGAVGGALKPDVAAARFSFHTENQGEGPFNNLYTGAKDGALKDTALRGQIQALINPDLTANLNVHYRDYSTTGTIITTGSYAANGVYRNGYVPSTNTTDVSTNAPGWSTIQQGGVNLNLQYQWGKYAVTSITGYEDFSTEALSDSDNTPLEISRGYAKGTSKQFSQELRIASPKEDKVNWVGGFHYFTEDITSDTVAASTTGVPVLDGTLTGLGYSDAYYTHKTTSYALFGSTTVNYSDKFLTTFGLRWTQESKDLDLKRKQVNNSVVFGNASNWWNTATGGVAVAALANNNFSSKPSTTWTGLTYDVTPEYKVNENLRTYFKYAHGIKSGGYNATATDVRALNTLDPETLDDFEIGFKSDLQGGAVRLNGSLFHYDYRNQQVNITGLFPATTNAVAYLQNVARSHVDGAELEIEALPLKNLHINANLGLLSTGFDQFDIQNNGGNRNGNEFVRSPHLTALFAADYRIPLQSGAAVVVGGDIRYTSSQFYYVDPQTDARGFLNQSPYNIVNARLSYQLPDGKQTITAYVNNLNDTIYENHSLTSFQAGTTNGDTIYWGARRSLGVNYVARF